MLRDVVFRQPLSERFKYATLGLLFVNVSIGGTLTHFAAPPVLMVAAKWQWGTTFMLATFGWKAALAILASTLAVTWMFRRELSGEAHGNPEPQQGDVPGVVVAIHLVFLTAVVLFAHHPPVFMGLFLFFLGYTEAYKRHQDRLLLREGLLVAFFLAGLVVLGGLQRWWLEAALTGVEPTLLYFIATALTAVTDNAALTYLASLVDGVSVEFKYAVVAGAVTGGGLTVIANAPNPAGFAILKGSFHEESISPLWLFLAALGPTCVAIFAFQVL
jgi:Na+/H+ antiporter NhaD/arsenite permease-like protein